ncbi:branched-chain amino acid transport system II carrier protein [Antarcticibacterium arcticum]|uniref:Branched-chain amino acid transport system II carrier protein n=1 Tax=Antarcticibacterium arcticum TaxID=2585771 RepID=A0A5B8YPS5_9FLAO|nr:branched-chain amino acid transport system II carrier protein [Antarcticibacterium arcticum]QED38326.1 branched-chain amino acid transport system II carrier protein [Antarcticibacterium arcticum]
MKFTKESLIVGFALFALFFGAGNLILPPFLGFFAGTQWYLVAIGFVISAVGLPLLGIFAHARLQGSIFNFSDKVSPLFSLIYCLLIYLISVTLPAPRTAAVTHEIAVQPFFDISALTTSILYFSLVFLFVIKRSTVINNIGKYLTPAILLLLLAIIITGIFSENKPTGNSITTLPVLYGFFEGYQTFDAIAAMVVGGVIIISVKLKGFSSPPEIRKIIFSAAIVTALGLLIVYGGLIYNGAIVSSEFLPSVTRTQLLSGISLLNLGSLAQTALAVLLALACFTTAVGIITGTADFMAERIKRPYTYPITVLLGCLAGIGLGALTVNTIIEIALPVLMLIYPLTIILIVLNVLPETFRSTLIMRAVVIVTIIFSLPDALQYVLAPQLFKDLLDHIPLATYGLAWVLPALATFVFAVFYERLSGTVPSANIL